MRWSRIEGMHVLKRKTKKNKCGCNKWNTAEEVDPHHIEEQANCRPTTYTATVYIQLQTPYEGDRVSLIIPFAIETQNIDFLRDFVACNINSAKKCKEIHNIVVSHLLTPALLRVFAVQCETLNESGLRSQTTQKEENNASEWQWIWHSDANPVEPRLIIP